MDIGTMAINHLGDRVVGGREKIGDEATGTTRLDTMLVLPYSFAWKSGFDLSVF